MCSGKHDGSFKCLGTSGFGVFMSEVGVNPE